VGLHRGTAHLKAASTGRPTRLGGNHDSSGGAKRSSPANRRSVLECFLALFLTHATRFNLFFFFFFSLSSLAPLPSAPHHMIIVYVYLSNISSSVLSTPYERDEYR
jgi:hypothetical protein